MKHASKTILPTFSAICLGAALGLCSLRPMAGLSDATQNSVQFAPSDYWSQAPHTEPTLADRFAVGLGDYQLVWGDLARFPFSTDKNGSATLPLSIAGSAEATSDMKILHALGKNAIIADGKISISGLAPNSDYQIMAGVVDYEYSTYDDAQDPTHAYVDRTVFWEPTARRMECAPSCALLLDAPKLVAIGPKGTIENAATHLLGQATPAKLLLSAFGAMLAFGATRLSARKLVSKIAPSVGALRVKL